MSQTDLVCSKCVGRRTVNNIMMKVNSKVMVTTVPPDQPLTYTRRPIFVSASVHKATKMLKLNPYRVHVKHELKEPDKKKILQYCRRFIHFIRGGIDI
jgi:hypothetical protein